MRSFLIKIFRFIVTFPFLIFRVNKKKIVFQSFMGRGYGDNPGVIANEILNKKKSWQLIWLVKKKDESMPKAIKQVKIFSPFAFYHMATSGIWISNTRGGCRTLKRKGQKYIQTWHGGGLVIKFVEGMVEDKLSHWYISIAKEDGRIIDYFISDNSITTKIFREYFYLNDNAQILQVGLPTNSALLSKKNNHEYVVQLRTKYNVDENCFLICYAPTFRDDGNIDCYKLDFKKIVSIFENKLKKDVKILIHLHPNVKNKVNSIIEFNNNVLDFNNIYNFEEIALISDFFISDYSGTIWDFLLLDKPGILADLDFDDYLRSRGLVLDNYYDLPYKIAKSNKELEGKLVEFDFDIANQKIMEYKVNNNILDNKDGAKKIVDLLTNIIDVDNIGKELS